MAIPLRKPTHSGIINTQFEDRRKRYGVPFADELRYGRVDGHGQGTSQNRPEKAQPPFPCFWHCCGNAGSFADRSAAEQEAVEIFFDWVFQPENFALIQNARGTVPVLGSMTEEHIALPESIAGILGDMNAAPYVKMGFNVYTAVFRDTVSSALCEFIGGTGAAQDIVNLMWETEQNNYFYQ